MTRKYAPILHSIWQNEGFKALTDQAQRVYLLAMSQPNITYVGVVPFTVRRWSRLAANTTTACIEKAVNDLEHGGFVMLDDDTEELWVRSFMRHNQVWEQPQLRKSIVRDFSTVNSLLIRNAILGVVTKEQVGSLVAACPQAGHHPASSLAEGTPAGSGKAFDLDLDLNHHSSSSDDDDPAALAAAKIAAIRLARRETERGPVGSKTAWLAAATNGVMAEVQTAINGGMTVEQAVRRIEPGAQENPIVADIKHRCYACAGSGWKDLDDNGNPLPCPICRGRSS